MGRRRYKVSDGSEVCFCVPIMLNTRLLIFVALPLFMVQIAEEGTLFLALPLKRSGEGIIKF